MILFQLLLVLEQCAIIIDTYTYNMGGGGQIHDLLRYLDPGLKIINLWQKEEKQKTPVV